MKKQLSDKDFAKMLIANAKSCTRDKKCKCTNCKIMKKLNKSI